MEFFSTHCSRFIIFWKFLDFSGSFRCEKKTIVPPVLTCARGYIFDPTAHKCVNECVTNPALCSQNSTLCTSTNVAPFNNCRESGACPKGYFKNFILKNFNFENDLRSGQLFVLANKAATMNQQRSPIWYIGYLLCNIVPYALDWLHLFRCLLLKLLTWKKKLSHFFKNNFKLSFDTDGLYGRGRMRSWFAQLHAKWILQKFKRGVFVPLQTWVSKTAFGRVWRF